IAVYPTTPSRRQTEQEFLVRYLPWPLRAAWLTRRRGGRGADQMRPDHPPCGKPRLRNESQRACKRAADAIVRLLVMDCLAGLRRACNDTPAAVPPAILISGLLNSSDHSASSRASARAPTSSPVRLDRQRRRGR